jgi:hypothetical protein
LNVGQPRRNGAGEVGSGASDLPGGGHHLAHLVFQAVTSPNRGSSWPPPEPARVPASEVEAIPGAFPEENPTPARLEQLSDGVFSIILTLLLLDLRVWRSAG